MSSQNPESTFLDLLCVTVSFNGNDTVNQWYQRPRFPSLQRRLSEDSSLGIRIPFYTLTSLSDLLRVLHLVFMEKKKEKEGPY